jgi:extracellular elastinolytic metalloproteinase
MILKNTSLLFACCLLTTALFAQSNFETALDHLQRLGAYQMDDLSDIRISDEYQSRHNGITHLYLQQRYAGIDVSNALMNFNLKGEGVSSVNGSFKKELIQKVNTTQAQINATQALQAVISNHNLQNLIPPVFEVSNTAEKRTVFEKGLLADDKIVLKLVYLEQDDNLKLCWLVSLYEKSCQNWWKTYVDAQNGNILGENNLVIHCSFHGGSHHSKTTKTTKIKAKTTKTKTKTKHLAKVTLVRNATVIANSYNVYAVPVESPNHGGRTLEISPWNIAGDAGTLGWHDDGTANYTHTRGNNADAYQDQNNSNAPTGGNDARANGGANLEFDFPIDLTGDPEDDPVPYITNLFYWNNLMHDIWYQYGFDEASGNFQEDNQGRGGSGSDYVRAEAQDGGGSNNANFSTPEDGGNPRMQMYLWNASDLDYLVVNNPGNVAGSYQMIPASFGAPLNNAITENVVEANDGTANPTLACNPLTNGSDISGHIALIDRGDCQFGTKCLNAQNAGAIAVIICNNEPGLLTMGAGLDGGNVTIPAVMISQGDCTTLRAELNNGLNTTMQVVSNPMLDGDLDNGIIAHEYGHGISIRLTGGPSNSGCLGNAEQMGEGWSDFFGIWMTVEANDNHTDIRGVGTYALGESTAGNGIRPAPYTTDMGTNDYTYGNVGDGNISQPHGVGFIWCTMIWDLNWAMVNQYGLDMDLYNGTGGNNITAQLIIDGLKGQPCNPGFEDGRDAILQADVDNNNGDNRDFIWNVFARRGLGFSASQGSSASRSDQTEAFDLPPDVPFLTEVELFEAGPLPVELTLFNAVVDNRKQQIDVFWTTASELNNKGFELQRRSEDNNVFKPIAWLDGKMESSDFTTYSYNDKDVRKGLEYYYRLKQVDHDGKEDWSAIVNASLKNTDPQIEVYPNPTNGISTVQFAEGLTGLVNLEILSAHGKVVGAQLFESTGGAAIEVDLSEQPEGVYFLRFEIGEAQIVKRVVLKR